MGGFSLNAAAFFSIAEALCFRSSYNNSNIIRNHHHFYMFDRIIKYPDFTDFAWRAKPGSLHNDCKDANPI